MMKKVLHPCSNWQPALPVHQLGTHHKRNNPKIIPKTNLDQFTRTIIHNEWAGPLYCASQIKQTNNSGVYSAPFCKFWFGRLALVGQVSD